MTWAQLFYQKPASKVDDSRVIDSQDLERQQLTLDGILARFWCAVERGEALEIHWQ